MSGDSASVALRALADDIEGLELRNDLLAARIAELEDERARDVRDAYRKGYRVGWGTGRAGRGRETAPERHARTSVRRALGGSQ